MSDNHQKNQKRKGRTDRVPGRFGTDDVIKERVKRVKRQSDPKTVSAKRFEAEHKALLAAIKDHNKLVDRHNDLVEEHNAVIKERDGLVKECIRFAEDKKTECDQMLFFLEAYERE